ncbi:MAG: hypothetical protein AAB409_03230 [Gemmatimonadota bacterium]
MILRYDAEAFETVTALAEAAVAAAAKRLTSTSVGLGPRAPKTNVPALTDVLDGIERLAA